MSTYKSWNRVPSEGSLSFSVVRSVHAPNKPNPISFSEFYQGNGIVTAESVQPNDIPVSGSELKMSMFRGSGTEPPGLYQFLTHNFTNCGALYNNGPTLSACQTSYNTTWVFDSSLFSMSVQGVQIWTVPQTGSYRFIVKGASSAGSGRIIQGTVSLTQGDKLHLVVGQLPQFRGGGGGSFVFLGTPSIGNTLIVAGGGGGNHSSSTFISGLTQTYGQGGGTGTYHGTSFASGGAGGENGSGGGGGIGHEYDFFGTVQKAGNGGGGDTSGGGGSFDIIVQSAGYQQTQYLGGGGGGGMGVKNVTATSTFTGGAGGGFGGGGGCFSDVQFGSKMRGSGGGGGYSGGGGGGGGGGDNTSQTGAYGGGGGSYTRPTLVTNVINNTLHIGHGVITITLNT